MLAWSHILKDQEVMVVANTSATLSQSANIILEIPLSTPGATLRVLYSNKQNPSTTPGPIQVLNQVTVTEVDGSTGFGPLHSPRVALQSMEVQFLRL